MRIFTSFSLSITLSLAANAGVVSNAYVGAPLSYANADFTGYFDGSAMALPESALTRGSTMFSSGKVVPSVAPTRKWAVRGTSEDVCYSGNPADGWTTRAVPYWPTTAANPPSNTTIQQAPFFWVTNQSYGVVVSAFIGGTTPTALLGQSTCRYNVNTLNPFPGTAPWYYQTPPSNPNVLVSVTGYRYNASLVNDAFTAPVRVSRFPIVNYVISQAPVTSGTARSLIGMSLLDGAGNGRYVEINLRRTNDFSALCPQAPASYDRCDTGVSVFPPTNPIAPANGPIDVRALLQHVPIRGDRPSAGMLYANNDPADANNIKATLNKCHQSSNFCH